MSCFKEEEALVFASVGDLSPQRRDEMERHLDECGGCRRLVAQAVRLVHAQTPDPVSRDEWFSMAPGGRISRYVVSRIIGLGSGGLVYEADDPELQRRVAIKVLHATPSQSNGNTGHARLLREAQAMARLAHPNVIPIFDVGTIGGRVFIVMEHVSGETLTAWLQRGRRHWREILTVFILAGRGLAAANAAGIIHRDFKPDNVLVDPTGIPRVTDFGVARPESTATDFWDETLSATSGAAGHNRLTTRAGTPAFMAPEQRSDGVFNARSDQFSYCVALFWALFGHHPSDRDAGSALGSMPIFLAAVGRTPKRLRDVLNRGLMPDPERRFSSMDELLAALLVASRRSLAGAGAVVAAIAITAAFALSYLGKGPGARPEQDTATCTQGDPRTATLRPSPPPFCFSEVNTPLDWSGAKEACAGSGGILAGCEANWACAVMVKNTSGPGVYWIGLVAAAPWGEFTWLPGLPPPSLNPSEHWAPGEPRVSATGPRCVATQRNGEGRDLQPPTWSTRDCAETHPFLCRHWAWIVSPSTRHAYRPLATPMTWDEARVSCHRLGMHLATISDPNEQRFLAERLPAGISEFWLGASDRDHTGGYRWVTGEALAYRDPLRPDNWHGTQHCLVFDSATQMWQDRECNLRYIALCEMEAP